MDDLERAGNLIEAGFWVVFATAIAIGASRRRQPLRLLGSTAGLIALLFGISDLVKSRTGAWWRPWWLLVWKGLCIAGLVFCLLKYRGLRVVAVSSNANPPQAPSSSM